MALLDMFFVTQVFLVSIVHLTTCQGLDVEYSARLVSDHKGDAFGWSLATSYRKLVIGAPPSPMDKNKRGSVMVDEGVRVKGPAESDGKYFGEYVDVNQQFMVVSGENPVPCTCTSLTALTTWWQGFLSMVKYLPL